MKNHSKKTKHTKLPVAVIGPEKDEKALLFPLASIRLGPNIRAKLENIEELAASIRANGLLQPLVVAKTGNGWELVAGYRRMAALKLLGEELVPVRITGADPNRIGVLRLVENIQRDELSGWETCRAIHGLKCEFGTQRELATAIGKSESFVSRCLAVVDASPEVARVQGLSIRELFALFAKGGAERRAASPQPGGRFVDGAIQLKNTAASGRFCLRVNYDPERTPAETRAKILETLRALVAKLEAA